MLQLLCGAAVLTATIALPARADETDKLTYLTFSKSVQLPGKTLPAGRYRFQLADTEGTRRVIKVQSEDGKKQLLMLSTVPNTLRDAPKDSLVMFKETAEGQPDAVKSWNYPGERIGYEFIYPKAQALIIAHETHQPVLAKDGDKIYHVDENGKEVKSGN
jgi:hypothetical protein